MRTASPRSGTGPSETLRSDRSIVKTGDSPERSGYGFAMERKNGLSCRCGAVHWQIAPEAPGAHVVCYCSDCQTAARHLRAEAMLDADGGTSIFQTLPAYVSITHGSENLALLRLSPKGLFRWHTTCCDTPVANTLARPGFAFCGMVLPSDSDGYGPVVARVQTAAARSPVREFGMAKAGLSLVWRALVARLNGTWRKSPFFTSEGQPAAKPHVLTLAERNAARPS